MHEGPTEDRLGELGSLFKNYYYYYYYYYSCLFHVRELGFIKSPLTITYKGPINCLCIRNHMNQPEYKNMSEVLKIALSGTA